MFKRRPKKIVSVTLDLPIEVAEFIGNHGEKLVSVIRRAVSDYKSNPPDPNGELAAKRKRRLEEISRKLKTDGRLGYRLLRQKIGTEAYIVHGGGIRNRLALSQPAWRRVILKDIAPELNLDFVYLEYAVRQFRKDLHRRIKARRETWTIRYHLAGFTDGDIAPRLGVSYQTINLYIKAARPEIFKILRENPEIGAEMRALVGTPIEKAPAKKGSAQLSKATRRQK